MLQVGFILTGMAKKCGMNGRFAPSKVEVSSVLSITKYCEWREDVENAHKRFKQSSDLPATEHS